MKKESKKIKERFYDANHTIWKILASFMDLFYISMMWFFCSLPVITIGAATTAAYDTVVHCVRRRETGILFRFASTLKNEFRNSLPCAAVCAVASAFWMLLLLYIPLMEDSALSFLFTVNAIVLGIVILGTVVWAFPIMSRFEMKPRHILCTSIKLIFAHMPITLLMTGMMMLVTLACVIWLFPLMILPALLLLFQSFFIENVFKQFS